MTVDQLKLAPNARRAAHAVHAAWPDVTFTSGRRDALDQARAMATNILKDRQWMLKTYKPTAIRTTLQRVVDEAVGVTERKVLAHKLYEAMLDVHSGELLQLSRHLTGDAFDIAWPGQAVADQIVAFLRARADEFGLDKILTREGHLQIIHAQFDPSIDV